VECGCPLTVKEDKMEYDINLKKEILENIEDNNAYLLGILTSIGRIETTEKIDNLVITHVMYQVALDVVRAIRLKFARSEIEMTFEEPKGNKKAREYKIIADPKTTRELIRILTLP
jgi:hypothetical protein